MKLDNYSKKTKFVIVLLLFIPLIISIALLSYLRVVETGTLSPLERFSPENRPLFIGIILFAVGYLFFLGLLFSDNIIEKFFKRSSLYKR